MRRIRTSRAIEAVGGTLLALACATAIWFAGAGTALAPEPSRTTSYLATGSSSALWISSRTTTTAYYLPATNWTVSSLPVGAPCTTVANVGNNYDLIKVIQGAGAYRRCV